MRRFVLPLLLAGSPFLATAGLAATTPADAIKYRQAAMAALAAHVNAFSLINFGRVEHQEHLQAHVEAIAALGAQTKVMFPAGTGTGDTEALPKIWEEQERFNELVAQLETSSAQLRDAAIAGDKAGTAAAFRAMGESCKGCHDRYRKPQ